MIHSRILASAALGIALLLNSASLAPAADQSSFDKYVGEDPPEFPDADAAVAALKTALSAGDLDGVARLMGLDAAKLKGAEGIEDRFEQIRKAAEKRVSVTGDDTQRMVALGDALWQFPFPLVKDSDGQWAFDTIAGIEEVINRRVGENELQAIETARAYVEGQRDYASDDHDEDGVLEYAQKLVSSEGKTDGLYWPLEQGDGESPAGGFVSEAELQKSGEGDGYFGYRFRILTGQGDEVAGGKYDYVINENMIAGFALVAWPVRYAETGVQTLVVNQAGIVYEKDLGADTEAVVKDLALFNPDTTWSIVQE
jgi:hypothetical protein